jgi:ankyrin repeat protein
MLVVLVIILVGVGLLAWRLLPEEGGFGMLDPQPTLSAVTSRDSAALEELLENGEDPDYTRGAHHRSLLEAVRSNDSIYAELLIQYGADVTWRDNWGYTYLHNAADSAPAEVVEVLLNEGVDPCIQVTNPSQPDGPLVTALDIAVEYENIEVAEVLQPETESC